MEAVHDTNWRQERTCNCMQAEVKAEVIAASVPSRILDPKPGSVLHSSSFGQQGQPQRALQPSQHGACGCQSAAAPFSMAQAKDTAAHDSHQSSAVNGTLDVPKEQMSTSFAAADNKTPVVHQVAHCPDKAAEHLSEAAEQQNGLFSEAAHGQSPEVSVAHQARSCPEGAADPLSGAETEGRSSRHMEVAGLHWNMPEGMGLEDCVMLWLGDGDAPALTQLMLMYSR